MLICIALHCKIENAQVTDILKQPFFLMFSVLHLRHSFTSFVCATGKADIWLVKNTTIFAVLFFAGGRGEASLT